jgi:tetratricopeptide (TPR) repeat protein
MMVRRGTASSILCLAWLAAGAVVAPRSVVAQEEITDRANQAYQEGDYSAAIEAYEDVLEAGFESGALYYNLGNAYFKSGSLGRSILNWERALERAPGDPDIIANLELARTLTADAVEPLPRFWLLSAMEWWVDLIPRSALISVVALAWLTLTGGLLLRVLARNVRAGEVGYWLTLSGALTVLLLGSNLLIRELGLGRPARAVIMVEAIAVRAAPADDDDLTLFEVHEGTRVRIDQRTGQWAEIVLDDGKVGWVPVAAMEEI